MNIFSGSERQKHERECVCVCMFIINSETPEEILTKLSK